MLEQKHKFSRITVFYQLKNPQVCLYFLTVTILKSNWIFILFRRSSLSYTQRIDLFALNSVLSLEQWRLLKFMKAKHI